MRNILLGENFLSDKMGNHQQQTATANYRRVK